MPETQHYQPEEEQLLALPEHAAHDTTFGYKAAQKSEEAWARQIDAGRIEESMPFDQDAVERVGRVAVNHSLHSRPAGSAAREAWYLRSIAHGAEAIADHQASQGRHQILEALQVSKDDEYFRSSLRHTEEKLVEELPPIFLTWMKHDPKSDQQPRLFDWLAHEATDDQMINFMQWNTDRVDRLNEDPEWRAMVDKQLERYKNRIAKAVVLRWLPRSAANLMQRADLANTFAADIVTNTLGGVDGFYMRDPGDNEYIGDVVLGNRMTALEDVQTHEFNHVLFSGFTDKQWLDEALTEHLARALTRGHLKSVDPDHKHRRDGAYRPERSILNTLMNDGDVKVGIKSFLAAYAEPDPQGPHHRALNERLQTAFKWSPNILDDLTNDINIFSQTGPRDSYKGLHPAYAKHIVDVFHAKQARQAKRPAAVFDQEAS